MHSLSSGATCVNVFFVGILALPFWASRPLARRAVLVLLIAVFSVMTLYQYLTVLFWPPFTSFYTNEWPYTISNKEKYFYLGFGPSARAYEIIPDFITLMMLCIAMQHLRLDSRKHAAMTCVV